jgi:hypothetical protein
MKIGTERGLLAGNKSAIVDVMGNPSALRRFPDQVEAHPPHTILAQARRLANGAAFVLCPGGASLQIEIFLHIHGVGRNTSAYLLASQNHPQFGERKKCMTDFHHNIFYYYRGYKQSKQDQYDQQLEDNTTKALVNTLKHCSPVIVLKFLEWLGIKATGKVEVELQKPTIGTEEIRRKSQRLLLGLVAMPEKSGDSICTKLEGPVSGDSRPDAWLYGEDFVVLIESKIGDATLELKQARRHFRKLQVDARQQPRCQVRTWAEVHQFFNTLLPELKDKNKWLVEQFVQYLEWKGMTEFSGFDEGMFEFFVHDEKDADTKKWVRDTMGRFAEKVLYGPNGLQAFNASFYESYHVGNFGFDDDHFWVAFGPAKFRKVSHQTISLYDYGLDVFVNVELSPAVNKLKEKIRGERQKFIEIISDLPEPFRIQIQERKRRENQPRTYDYYIIATLEAGARKPYHPGPYGLKDPQSSGFNYLTTLLLEQIQYPCLSVRKRIDRKRVLELSKENKDTLVDEVVQIMKAFHPLVKFING